MGYRNRAFDYNGDLLQLALNLHQAVLKNAVSRVKIFGKIKQSNVIKSTSSTI